MGQIEELPDDFDEALDLNRLSSETKTGAGKQSAGLRDGSKDSGQPPAAASEEPKTARGILDMMNSTPLFMTDLGDAADAGTQPPSPP